MLNTVVDLMATTPIVPMVALAFGIVKYIHFDGTQRNCHENAN